MTYVVALAAEATATAASTITTSTTSTDAIPQGVRRNDPEILRDEITWSPYATLDYHLSYFIFVA